MTRRFKEYWLDVRDRDKFELWLIVYKCFYEIAPIYLTDPCKPVGNLKDCRHFCSTTTISTTYQTVDLRRESFCICWLIVLKHFTEQSKRQYANLHCQHAKICAPMFNHLFLVTFRGRHLDVQNPR